MECGCDTKEGLVRGLSSIYGKLESDKEKSEWKARLVMRKAITGQKTTS